MAARSSGARSPSWRRSGAGSAGTTTDSPRRSGSSSSSTPGRFRPTASGATTGRWRARRSGWSSLASRPVRVVSSGGETGDGFGEIEEGRRAFIESDSVDRGTTGTRRGRRSTARGHHRDGVRSRRRGVRGDAARRGRHAGAHSRATRRSRGDGRARGVGRTVAGTRVRPRRSRRNRRARAVGGTVAGTRARAGGHGVTAAREPWAARWRVRACDPRGRGVMAARPAAGGPQPGDGHRVAVVRTAAASSRSP